MKPDRTNYGLWIIDMLDGNLDKEGVMELKSFLSGNPDLRDEFESFFPDKLVPNEAGFSGKEELHKGVTDLSMSQIDLLSVAALEKDLTPEEESDLTSCRKLNLAAERRYNTIQKLKLVPGKEGFTNKRPLKRAVISPASTRKAVALLSAAAIIIFLLIIRTIVPRTVDESTPLTFNSENNVPTSEILVPLEQPEIATVSELPKKESSPEKTDDANTENVTIMAKEPENVTDPYFSENMIPSGNMVNSPEMDDPKEIIPSVYKVNSQEIVVSEEIISSNYVVYEYGIPPVEIFNRGTLSSVGLVPVALNNIGKKTIATQNLGYGGDGDRTIISKFIANAFRKRVLDQKSPSDDPIKGYEVAEAWVLTLNRLWETEMAFIKNTDENGEVESVYFDAGLVKFNSKVKKSGVEL